MTTRSQYRKTHNQNSLPKHVIEEPLVAEIILNHLLSENRYGDMINMNIVFTNSFKDAFEPFAHQIKREKMLKQTRTILTTARLDKSLTRHKYGLLHFELFNILVRDKLTFWSMSKEFTDIIIKLLTHYIDTTHSFKKRGIYLRSKLTNSNLFNM